MAFNRWWILAVLFLARTSMGFQFQSVASVSPFLIDELGIDYAMLGTLIGLYNLPGVLFALPGGVLGRRFGDKRIVLCGLVMMALGGALVGVADDFATAAVGRILSGCGGVLLNILLAKMTMDWFAERELVLAMAILVNSWPLGIALGLVSQSAAAVALGWPVVPHATAAFALVSFGLIAVGYRRPPGAAAPAGSAGRFLSLSKAESGRVSLAAATWTLFNVGLILIVSFGPTFLTARGRPLDEAGWIVSLGTWLGIATIPLGGYVAQRWACPRLVMAVCLAAAAAICVAMPWAGSPLWRFVAFGIFAWAPAGPIMALASESLSAGGRALGMGVFYTWYYAGMGALPALAGLVRDATRSPDAPVYLAGAMMLGSLLLVAWFATARRGSGSRTA